MASLYDDHADLYDLAFDWDLGPEADWLLERFGADATEILEPACGSGRMFPELVKRGVTVFGVDLSEAMLARARARMAALGVADPPLLRGDIREFDWGRTLDGAICPINTFGYLLTDEDALRHLECVARHLRPGGKYLVQSDVRCADPFDPGGNEKVGRWEVDGPDFRLAASWEARGFDPATRVATFVSRFEFLSGPEAGRVIENEHPTRIWDHAAWSALIEASPFTQAAAYDGNAAGRPPLSLGPGLEEKLLLWHELVRE
jgi:SAM-dependent methyltransferase